jgi:hypothetical protein
VRQQRGELIVERAAFEAQMTELHHRKSALKAERALLVDHMNIWARAREVVAAINREGT